jgi:hypothetical protein
MADPAQIAAREEQLLTEVRAVIDQLDPEVGEQLRHLHPGGGVPNSFTMPDQFGLFVAEALALLFRQAAPRRRGRPRKQEAS